MNVKIKEVKTKADIKAFINLPRKIYRNDPLWVLPIWNDENKLYTEKHIKTYKVYEKELG